MNTEILVGPYELVRAADDEHEYKHLTLSLLADMKIKLIMHD